MQQMYNVNLVVSHGACQRPCVYCLYPLMPVKSFMSLDVARKFAALNASNINQIRLRVVPIGEALINPEIFDIFKEIQIFNPCTLSTNLAVPLSEDQLKIILDTFSRIDIHVTTVGISAGLVSLAEKNIQRLLQKAGAQSIRFLQIEHPREQLTPFLKTLDRVIEPLQIYTEEYVRELCPAFSYREYRDRLGISEAEITTMQSSGALAGPELLAKTCHFDSFQVLPDGRVSACYLARPAAKEYLIGDATKETIADIAKSEQFTRACRGLACNTKTAGTCTSCWL